MTSEPHRWLARRALGPALLVGLSACLVRVEGTRVDVHVDALPSPDIVRDDGSRIQLTSALVTVSSLELFPDDDTAAPGAEFLARAGALLSPIGVAHAHGASGPTRIGTTTVVDLLGDDVNLGTLAPDAGRYREVLLELAPADDDAVGLEQHPEVAGRTLVLEGKVMGASGEDLGPFYLATSSSLEVSVILDDAEAVVLTSTSPQGELSLTLEPGHWFDGVDPRIPTAGAEVLEQIGASLRCAFEATLD